MTILHLPFGRDTWCLESRQTGRMANGIMVAAQRVFRRFITERGTLRGGEDERNFGLDLAGLCGAAVTPALEAAMPQRISNEAQKDAEVESCSATFDKSVDAGKVTWTFHISCQTAGGPFALVVAVSDATVELLGVTT